MNLRELLEDELRLVAGGDDAPEAYGAVVDHRLRGGPIPPFRPPVSPIFPT